MGDSPQEAQDSLSGICLIDMSGCVIEAGDIWYCQRKFR